MFLIVELYKNCKGESVVIEIGERFSISLIEKSALAV